MSGDSALLRGRDRWDRFWFGQGSLVNLGVFRIVMMLAVYDALGRFAPAIAQHLGGETASYVHRPWNPIYALEVLGLGPPSAAFAHATHIVVFAAMVLALVGLFSRAACLVVAIGFTYMAGVHYSLGKPHHDCIQLTFGLWALACAPSGRRVSLDAFLARIRSVRAGGDPLDVQAVAPWAAFPIRVTQISIALGYFFAGASKIAIGGLEWANGYTLQAIMLSYEAEWSQALGGNVLLCQLMQIGLLVVQTSFPLVFLHRSLRWFYVPAAVSFHLMAMQTMSTGHFLTLWFPLLAAFVDWERVPEFVRRHGRSGPMVVRVALLVSLAGAAWVVASVYMGPRPRWMLVYLAVPLAMAFWLVAPASRLVVRFDATAAGPRLRAAVLSAFDWAATLELRSAQGLGGGLETFGRRGAAAWRQAACRVPLGAVLLPFAGPADGAPARRPMRRRALDGWRGWRTARAMLTSQDPEPTLEHPVSQAATAAQCADPIYARWCEFIREQPRLHRKQWEFVYVLRALEVAGQLDRGRHGLGFGVGREPLVAALAARDCRILATDLASDDPRAAGWRQTGEYGGERSALNERGICPADAFDERVRFEVADMRTPSTISGTFDFVWSSCALEHLGSLGAGLDFIRASLERLAPGGVAVHTTEFNVSSDHETSEDGPVVLYRRRDLLALAEELRSKGYEIELNLNTGGEPEDRYVDLWPYDGSCHLKMLYTRFATTSIGLIIRRPDTAS